MPEPSRNPQPVTVGQIVFPPYRPGSMAGDLAATTRIRSVDVARGAVMILMALDHVRVFSGVPAGGPTPALFLTRWVTNFCAPVFFFLAGAGAYLYARKAPSRSAVARWLALRGALLVLLELTVLRLAWTFNFDYAHYLLAGVIWALGLSMMVMAALVFVPLRAVAVFGVGTIVLHDAVAAQLVRAFPELASGGGPWLAALLYFGGPIRLGGTDGPTLFVLYSLFSWVSLMAAGYAFGAVLKLDPARRDRILLTLGAGAVAAFLMLRGLDVYGDPRHWRSVDDGRPAWIRFLGTSKYPASLLFTLMTLGPMFLVMPALERARGAVSNVLAVFGRVPLFFYLLHIPVIHAMAMLVSVFRDDGGLHWLVGNHPVMIGPAPEGYRWSLVLLYAITALCIALLYLPCRWFAVQRAARPESWLRYL